MTRLGVIAMALVLGLYIVCVAVWGVSMLTSGQPIAITMGIALIVLPLIAAWSMWRELSFGRNAQRLGQTLEAEGTLPEESVELYPSGRVRKSAGDALFPQYREAVQAAPDDWRAWYRLGLVYDAAGDRSRARQAIRKAISVEKA